MTHPAATSGDPVSRGSHSQAGHPGPQCWPVTSSAVTQAPSRSQVRVGHADTLAGPGTGRPGRAERQDQLSALTRSSDTVLAPPPAPGRANLSRTRPRSAAGQGRQCHCQRPGSGRSMKRRRVKSARRGYTEGLQVTVHSLAGPVAEPVTDSSVTRTVEWHSPAADIRTFSSGAGSRADARDTCRKDKCTRSRCSRYA